MRLILNIEDIVRQGAAEHAFSMSASADAFDGRLDGCGIASEITVEGKAVNCGDGVVEVIADVKTRLELECARCLEPVALPFELSLDEQYSHTEASGDEDEAYVYEGEKLDLSGAVADNILGNLPMRVLCSPDCKGLCPVCGANKNTTRCDCDVTVVDPRLEALKALISDEEV